MAGLGPPELILILVIVMIIFGPGKLAGLGSSLGKSLREFRQATQEPDSEEPAGEATPAAETTVTAETKVTVEEPKPTRAPTVSVADEPSTAAAEPTSQGNKVS